MYKKEVEEKVRNENPDLKYQEITKKIGELFNSLPEKKKKKY